MSEPMVCPRRAEAIIRRDLPDHDEWRDGRCSYCGSATPEAVFEAIDKGEELVPTDKSYKVYVGSAHRKFYFQHFDQAQRERFVELINAKAIKLAYPGHFYQLPFFVKPVPEGA